MRKTLVASLVMLVMVVGVGFAGCLDGKIVRWDTPQDTEGKLPPYYNPWTGVGFSPAGGNLGESSFPRYSFGRPGYEVGFVPCK